MEPTEKKLNRYVVWQIAATLIVLFAFLLFVKQLPFSVQLLTTALIVVTLINCGAILEQRRWIFYLEYTRYILLLWLLIAVIPDIKIYAMVALSAFLTIAYFQSLQKFYLGKVYRDEALHY